MSKSRWWVNQELKFQGTCRNVKKHCGIQQEVQSPAAGIEHPPVPVEVGKWLAEQQPCSLESYGDGHVVVQPIAPLSQGKQNCILGCVKKNVGSK